MYYDRQGKQITPEEWARLFANREYQQLATTEIEDVSISTVWLGLDHSRIGGSPPMIFETMIFGGEYNEEMWRYSTEEAAYEGHAYAIRVVKGTSGSFIP